MHARLKLEIDELCGSITAPTRTELKRMKFLDAVIKEGPFLLIIAGKEAYQITVLRLYPSVPVNSRMATQTTTLPSGGGSDGSAPVLVVKGEAVGYCPYAMHRRKELFGPDAANFRPERWLENEGRLASSVGYGYLPFNAGPRVCLGRTSPRT